MPPGDSNGAIGAQVTTKTGPMSGVAGENGGQTSMAYMCSWQTSAGETVIVNFPLLPVPPIPILVSSPSKHASLGPQSKTWMHVGPRFGRPKPMTIVDSPWPMPTVGAQLVAWTLQVPPLH